MTQQTRSGDIGETIAAKELDAHGWAVSWPRANQPNYDLIVEKGGKLKRVQVKTSRENENLDWILAGKCTVGILYHGEPMLNTVAGHEHCEIVMCVTYLRDDPDEYRVWLFPVDQAEEYFRKHAIAYYTQPKRDGSPRKPGPVFIQTDGKRPYRGVPDDRQNLAPFENAWHYVEQ